MFLLKVKMAPFPLYLADSQDPVQSRTIDAELGTNAEVITTIS